MNKSANQESISPNIGVNQFREMLYLFLSRAFSKEADEALLWNASEILNSLEDLSDLPEISQEENIQSGKNLLRGFFKEIEGKEQEKVLTDLSREYAASFLGVGERTVALCESIYQYQSSSLFQESYFEVKERYKEIGMEKSDDFKDPDDHLSVELALMAHLCRLTINASGNNSGKLLYYLKSQEEFLKQHLIQWVPELSEGLKETTHSTFYRSMAHLVDGFIKMDGVLIDSLIEEAKSLP
jgi:TorA maturation chaperone TorD